MIFIDFSRPDKKIDLNLFNIEYFNFYLIYQLYSRTPKSISIKKLSLENDIYSQTTLKLEEFKNFSHTNFELPENPDACIEIDC